jgi:hypothetical protein
MFYTNRERMPFYFYWQTEGSAIVGKPFDVIVKLVNPLSVPLAGGSICMEGPGMVKPSSVKIK